MSLVAAGVIGIVVGYGLGLWRESRRTRDCQRDCPALREYRRQRLHQDQAISALYQDNARLARRMLLQERVDATRNAANK